MNIELNAQIATKVMGWEEITDPAKIFVPCRSTRIWVSSDDAVACEKCGTLPDFSGSLEDAWRVVEYMATHDPVNPPTEPQASGYWLRLQSPFEPGLPWNAGFTQHSFTGWNGRPDYRGQGATAAEAICMAALAPFAGTDLGKFWQPIDLGHTIEIRTCSDGAGNGGSLICAIDKTTRRDQDIAMHITNLHNAFLKSAKSANESGGAAPSTPDGQKV